MSAIPKDAAPYHLNILPWGIDDDSGHFIGGPLLHFQLGLGKQKCIASFSTTKIYHV